MFGRALALVDVSQEDIACFAQTKHEDILWGFTEAILDSNQWTVEVESYDPVDVLSDLVNVLEPLGVAMEVDEKDNQIEVFIPSDGKRRPYDRPNREGDFFYRTLVEDECIHEVVFAFEHLLPSHVTIYALVYLDESDSPAYAVLRRDQEDALQQLLGSRFSCIFIKHRPGTLFRKTTEPLREGD